MAKTSKKPTNLTGSLDVVRFRSPASKVGRIQYLELALSWNPPSNCTDQDCYLVYNGADPPKKKTDLNGGTKSKKYEIEAENYYPTNANKTLDKMQFGVDAHQKGKKRSDFTTKTFFLSDPGVPIVSVPQVDTSAYDSCTFSWSQNPYDNDVEKRKLLHYTFVSDYEWETILTDSSSYPSDSVWIAYRSANVTVLDPTTGVPVIQPGYGSTVSTSLKFYETPSTIEAAKYRHVRVRARGPSGPSDWASTYYMYGIRAKVSTSNESITKMDSSETTGKQTVAISNPGTSLFQVACQYAVVVPRVTTSVQDDTRTPSVMLPIGFDSWTTYKVFTGTSSITVNASFQAPALDNDEVIFVRTVLSQNGQTRESAPKLLRSTYKLPTPTIGVTDINPITYRATVTIGGTRSSIEEAYTAIYFRTDTIESRIIAIADSSTTSLTVQAPEWSDDTEQLEFGIQAFVGPFKPASTTATEYFIDTSDIYLSSNTVWREDLVPKQPKNVTLNRVREGVMHVGFEWNWAAAEQAELSWSMDPDAWNSTDEPQTYVMSNTHSGSWNIAGLSAGTWYVKVRFIKTFGDSVTYGMYSDRKELSMSAAPDTPSLHITGGNPSSDIATYAGSDESLTAYWAYKSNDGTNQMEATFAEAVLVDGQWTFTEIPDKHVAAETHFTFTPEEMGWTSDSMHHLSVRLRSMSDVLTDNWSAPITVVVASKPSIALGDIGGENDSIVENEEGVNELVKLPLDFTIVGGDTSWTTTIVIERAQSTNPRRPDDSDEIRFAGETIYVNTIHNQGASTSISIGLEDLLGKWKFDQGVPYILTVTSKDSYGQTSEPVRVEFIVNWDRSAAIPDGIVEVDHEHNVVFLTPKAITGINQDDVCDIYRYSVDGLTCIAENLDFEEKYVDKFPTLGKFGGYRFVTRTPYGDYKTADNDFAWVDFNLSEDGGQYIDDFAIIIDYGGDSLRLKGNIAISDSWKKDFQLTRYLGGSLIGDWNPGVERTGSHTAVIPVNEEEASILALRTLSEYIGKCRIRTPEGSNYFANVEVKDDRESKWVNRLSKVSLSINRIDSVDDEVVTYAKWLEELEEELEEE